MLRFPPAPRYVNASQRTISLLYQFICFGSPLLLPSYFGALQPKAQASTLNKSAIIPIEESADKYEAIL